MLFRSDALLLFLSLCYVIFFGIGFVWDAYASPSTTTMEQGYEGGELYTPYSLATGGAVTAVGTSTTALFANVGNLPKSQVYHAEGFAFFSPQARRQIYGGAISDSLTSALAGAFGGVWSSLDPSGIDREWVDLRLALAYPLGDSLSVGMAGKYKRITQRIGCGPFGSSVVSDGAPDSPILDHFNMDVGANLSLDSSLFMGIAGRNLIRYPDTPLSPLIMTAGVGGVIGNLILEGGGALDFTTWDSTKAQLGAGGQLTVGQVFPLRLGYQYHVAQEFHAVSGGVGYRGPSLGLDISVQQTIAAAFPMTMFGIGLQLFLESTMASSGF
ncbi:hypothetical protein [Pajaroellobacter abortibovis]|uniref:Uncharacterized protein n=1 Tax=Pajaroellobacter abortibovis TaxID=1882918 RepID=A0A1L6MYH3_9BACT|nr:hypothetical protein [Pajaroellobacter abortibovis]APS00580.1 hypothetical protein BCY86_07755 [Pajaroellobacter abortibovis]